MAVYSQIQAIQVSGTAIGKLVALREAFIEIGKLYAWTSSIAASDLVALGMTLSDANMILSAVADANAQWQMYNTGLPPATYPQPPSAYVYGQSQRALIGPQ
jgi:hypothetical protein